MRIAVIGAGQVGAGIGKGWVHAGHDVRYGVRDPSKYSNLGQKRLFSPADAIEGAEVVLLATPWNATEEAILSIGDLSGMILIDATNPLRFTDNGISLDRGFSCSGGEQVATWANGAKVVKAFNHAFAEVMSDPRRHPMPPVMFVAGNDIPAKEVVLGLMAELGMDALDAGPLENARLLEPLAMLMIDLGFARGLGRDFALVRSTRSSHS